MSRSGFTMIELIFVIVILGILAALSIPKMAATRDDANTAKAVSNLSIAINDMGSAYTVNGSFPIAPILDCFTLSGEADGMLTVDSATGEDYCMAAVAIASNQGLIGTHMYGGNSVSF